MANGTAALDDALRELEVPAEFNVYESAEDREVVARLDAWKQRAQGVLEGLRERLKERGDVTAEEKALFVAKVAQLDGAGPWVTEETRARAQGESWFVLCLRCAHG